MTSTPGPLFSATQASAPFADAAPQAEPPIDLHSLGIQHVFLIVKENRTYDQVLGDVAAGNGRADLAIYGERVTPNLHNLARQFVLFDNYYASGTVSADGHQWITQAMATDYAERQANAGWPRSYPYSGEDPLIFAPTGFHLGQRTAAWTFRTRLWRVLAASAGYPGSWTDYLKASVPGTPTIATPSVSPSPACRACTRITIRVPSGCAGLLQSSIGNGRVAAWEANGNAPNLVIIQLPGDHTVGTTPGAPTPQAMVADNDLGAARIVEAISHSSLWPTSAVFLTEDDAQDGVDHVDGHRTTCFLASPFARRNAVDSVNYNHTSLVRTIEDLLGLPVMNRFDATANPMRNAFTCDGGYDAVHRRATEHSPRPGQPATLVAQRTGKQCGEESGARVDGDELPRPGCRPGDEAEQDSLAAGEKVGVEVPEAAAQEDLPKDADD